MSKLSSVFRAEVRFFHKETRTRIYTLLVVADTQAEAQGKLRRLTDIKPWDGVELESLTRVNESAVL